MTSWPQVSLRAKRSNLDQVSAMAPAHSGAHSREAPLDQPDKQRGAERQSRIVEIIARIVHFAAALAVAVADLDVGAGNALEHVGEILRRHDEPGLAVDVVVADQFGRGVGDEAGLVAVVDERWEENAEIEAGGGAETA